MKRIAFKVLLATLLLAVLIDRANSQVLVSDPVANSSLILINNQLIAQNSVLASNLTTTASEVTATSATVASTLNVLKSIENKLLQINSILTTVIYIKNIVAREKEILRMQKEITRNMQTMKRLTPEELQMMNTSLLVAVRTTESFITLANDLLTQSSFRMGDDSRLSQFLSIDSQLAIQQSIMKVTYLQYVVIDEERAILGAVRK